MATDEASAGDPPLPRRTPNHPPYSLMIGEAIRSLAEEGGSTEVAISQHIQSHYDDLPWGHDRLLPYYLNKLTLLGEFVAGAPGRYLINGDLTEPPAMQRKALAGLEVAAEAAEPAPAPRRRGRPRKSKPEFYGDGGVAGTPAVVLALPSPAPKRGRGRPRKAGPVISE